VSNGSKKLIGVKWV